jgi:polyisoprenoid-binding protein YceI
MVFFLIVQNYQILNKSSQINFWVYANFHRIEGKADEILSQIFYNNDTIYGYIKVYSKSLKTFNPIRDAQMYRTIKADQYEFIEFLVDSLKNNKVFGKFRLAGVEKMLSVSLQMKFENDSAYIDGNFKILLSDFNIKRPKFGFLEVSDTVNISFHLIFKKT